MTGAKTLGPDDEPQNSGAVVAVHWGDYRCQEIWVRSGSNIGNWYCLGGEYGRPKEWDDPRDDPRWMMTRRWDAPTPRPGPGEVPRHPRWEHVLERGPVTLLSAADDEAYAAGWANGRRRLVEQFQELSDEEEGN